VKNKKHIVKQTKKRENNTTKKEKGKDQFLELDRLINTLKNKPVLFHLNQEKEEEEFIIFEQGMQKINYYTTGFWGEENITDKDTKTYQEEQVEYIKRRIKIMNPTKFDLDKVFEDLKQFFVQGGRFIEFIKKIDSMEEKVDSISSWETITGEKTKYPFPLEVYKTTLRKKAGQEGPPEVIYTATKSTTEIFKIKGGPYFTQIKKVTIPAGKPLPLEPLPPNPSVLESSKFLIIREFLEQYFKGLWTKRYFTVPAKHKYWNALLLLFTGNPGIFRKPAFKKTYEERTPEEQAEVEAETQKLIGIKEMEGQNQPDIKGVDAVKIYTPKVDIQLKKNTDETGEAGDILFAEIISENEKTELFKDPEYIREKALRQFYETIGSPEGLRHFLAILEGLDDAGQKGFYTFKMDEHLDRLGFKRYNNAHRVKHKEKAIEVIRTLSNTVLEVEDPENENFNVSFTLLKTSIRHDKITRKVKDLIISMDPWYIHSFQGAEDKEPQFMRLLRELPKENHRDHPYTLLLIPRLATFWRIEKRPGKIIKLSSILAFLNINNSKTYKENIRILESELNYMKSRDHLGDWHHDGNHEKMAESSNPENIKITFVAPDWAIKEINALKEKHESLFSSKPTEDINPMKKTEFLDIYEYLLKRYSQREMARHMGISRTNLSNFKTGKRPVTDEMAQKIRAFYFQELEKDPGSDGI